MCGAICDPPIRNPANHHRIACTRPTYPRRVFRSRSPAKESKMAGAPEELGARRPTGLQSIASRASA
eukprot:3736155-Alexandrium_andersonii.AAC.1